MDVRYASEYKFVEWSQGISSENFDDVHMAGNLPAPKRGPHHGRADRPRRG
jgi:hypothetical protein